MSHTPTDLTTEELKRLAAENRDDPQYLAALGLMVLTGRTATSLVQRALGIGYNAAARIVERIEADGIISRPNSAGKRELIELREADAPVTAREAEPVAWQVRYHSRWIMAPSCWTDEDRANWPGEHRALYAHPPQPIEAVAEAAEIERMTAALEKANANHEHFEREWYLASYRAEKAEAERDEARALVAAAFVAAADKAGERCAACGVREIAGLVREHVVRLTPDNAKTTLEAYGREKMREGMQWAAEIIRGCCPECLGTGVRDSGGVHPWGEPISVPCDCTDAILGGMETIV